MVLSPAAVTFPANPDSRILVAVSGGLDSVVLLHLLHLRGAKTGVAHCNFGLRGAESDGDEAFVKSLAKEYNIPFYCTRFSTLQHAGTNGISTQMAARDLRYNWFEKIRKENNFDLIATAHHLNDSVETVLLNLLRGTGPAGLRGITELSDTIIRPLLNFCRDHIQQYAEANNLTWRNDSSNDSDYYKRNFLRHQIIPELQKLNPNLLQNMGQTMQRMTDATHILIDKAAEVRNQAVTELKEQVWIKTGLLPKNGLPLLLHELIKPYNFTYLQAAEISKNLQQHSGKYFFSPSHRLLFDRQQLIITPIIKEQVEPQQIIEKSTTEIDLGDHFLLMNWQTPENFHLRKTGNVAALDAGKLKFPLMIRKWLAGDKFQPMGMKGRKKVSDFFIDQKIPVSEKEKTWVLVSGREIAWLVGHRVSEQFKVTAETQNILEIDLLKK